MYRMGAGNRMLVCGDGNEVRHLTWLVAAVLKMWKLALLRVESGAKALEERDASIDGLLLDIFAKDAILRFEIALGGAEGDCE